MTLFFLHFFLAFVLGQSKSSTSSRSVTASVSPSRTASLSASPAPFALPQPLAGYADGATTAASFNFPGSVTIGSLDGSGVQTAYVADTGNGLIRAISPSGAVSTFAGGLGATATGTADGTGTNAAFSGPQYVTIFAGTLFVSETLRIRAVSAGGSVSVVAGGGASGTDFGWADGTGTSALFSFCYGIAANTNPNAASPTLFIADGGGSSGSNAIRAVNLASRTVTTIAGGNFGFASNPPRAGYADGVGLAAAFRTPIGLAFDGLNTLYIADFNNAAIRAMAVDSSTVTTFAGFNCTQKKGCSFGPYADGMGSSASFSSPAGLAFLPSASPSTGAGTLYVANSGYSTIRAITVSGKGESVGKTATLAGNAAYCADPNPKICGGFYAFGYANGAGTGALFQYPYGVAVSGGNALLVADTFNNVIRKISFSGGTIGTVVTFAGGLAATPAPAPPPARPRPLDTQADGPVLRLRHGDEEGEHSGQQRGRLAPHLPEDARARRFLPLLARLRARLGKPGLKTPDAAVKNHPDRAHRKRPKQARAF